MPACCDCLEKMRIFFINDTATTEIYTLSLHDALPILGARADLVGHVLRRVHAGDLHVAPERQAAERVLGLADLLLCDQRSESTRLNSSHANISYAVFCLKKKNKSIKVTFEL